MIPHWLQNPLVETFGWTLLHSLWQLAFIAAVAYVVLFLLRRASANARYLVCLAALILMASSPIATAIELRPARQAAAALSPTSPLSASKASLDATHSPLLASSPLSPPLPEIARTPNPTFSQCLQPFLPYAVILYLAGTILLATRLLVGCMRLRQLRRRTISANPALQAAFQPLLDRLTPQRRIPLLESVLIEVPTVIGILRPVILFPASALTGLTPDQLTALLAHELAHIRRHDALLNLCQTLAETFLFYHPAIWWLSGQIRQEREHCCDDLAATITGSRINYAHALVQMESLRPAPSPISALALATHSTALLPRIRRLLGVRPPHSNSNRLATFSSTLLATAALVALVYLIGCNTHDAASYPQDYANGNNHSTLQISPENPDAPLDEDTPADRAVRQHLEKNIKELVAQQMPFEKVINFLRDQTGTNIFVNWTALEKVAINRKTLVTVNVSEIPFRKALTTLLSEVGQGNVRLGFIVDGGVITISTKDDLDSEKYQVVRVYDIQDILVQPDSDANPPLGPLDPPSQKSPPSASHPARQQIATDIINTIKTTIAPETWRDAGGKIGTIRELNGQLIINQTTVNHRAIYNLIQQLRETRGMQIAVETRVILVNKDLLKKLNLTQSKDGGFASQVFDARQFKELRTTLDTSSAAICLDFPRVTLFNGQNGYLAETREQNFLAGCSTTVDEQHKVTYEKKIETLVTGMCIGMEPTVSADRRYVFLKARPGFRQLEKMEKYPFPDAVAPKFFLERPVAFQTFGNFRCSVPDRQFLVLSGIKINPGLLKEFPDFDKLRPEHKIRDMGQDQVIIVIYPSILDQAHIRDAQPPMTPSPLK